MSDSKTAPVGTTTTMATSGCKKWVYKEGIVSGEIGLAIGGELWVVVGANHLPERKLWPNQPLFQFFSEPLNRVYRYFSSEVKGLAFPPALQKLCQIAKQLCPDVPFDAAFVNVYRSGKDHVPPHRDSTHGKEYPI